MRTATADSSAVEGVRPCEGRTARGTACKNNALAGHRRCAPHLGRAGRKSKLDAWRAVMLVEASRLGATFREACEAADISEATGYNWRHRGRADLIEGTPSPFSRLLSDLRQAEAEWELVLITSVRRGMRKNWRIAGYLLEYRDPDQYRLGRLIRQLEANPPWVKPPPPSRPLDLSRLSPEKQKAFKRLQREARRDPPAPPPAKPCQGMTAAGEPCPYPAKERGKCATHLGHARRPSKADRAAMKKIVELVRAGLSYISACTLSGIEKEKARTWEEVGQPSTDLGIEATSPYEKLGWAVRKAEAEFQMECVGIIRDSDGWGALWLLERHAPEAWCLRYLERRSPEEMELLRPGGW